MRKCNEDENAAVVTEDVSMSPETYQYFLGLENRRIVINEEIGSDLVTKVILPLLDFDNDGSGEPIEILTIPLVDLLWMGWYYVTLLINSKHQPQLLYWDMHLVWGVLF